MHIKYDHAHRGHYNIWWWRRWVQRLYLLWWKRWFHHIQLYTHILLYFLLSPLFQVQFLIHHQNLHSPTASEDEDCVCPCKRK